LETIKVGGGEKLPEEIQGEGRLEQKRGKKRAGYFLEGLQWGGGPREGEKGGKI